MGCFSYFCGRDSKWKEETSTAKWRVFSLKELHSATNNFNYDNKVGEGSFGSVYWGQLWDGSQIAVKRLKAWNNKAEGEFTAEVEVLGKVRHKNLLCLRGCCAEGQERLIVYDYMPNLSLHSHLHGSHSRDSLLDWKRRMSIAIASSEGIAYLHHHATPHIIHQDIKASNILLDNDFKARVADFGFAKLIPDGDYHVRTNAKGTLGYQAPEYSMYGKSSESCDVYRFGVLLLEIVSGKKPVEKSDLMQKVSITDWALPLAREGRFIEIVDSKLNDDYVEGELKRLVLVGLVCAQNEPEKRPTMLEVAALLKGELKEKMALIESDEVFQPGSGAISEDTEVLNENLDSLTKESVEEVKEAVEIEKIET
ncbi:Protein kinase superfamily protein [Rhynchospora pubera]|uniref:Protein kinase superfamily protein n=1 Tax=Rhynchospora pubera TaxID=906938 RepID=A0AAV8BR77_9POAL|nr:Protein kinase superfamily protein [Rhynchospora pubera]